MRPRHLELIQKDNAYFIKINSLTGRLSLLCDHPVFNWVQAKDLKNIFYKINGAIQLVPLKQKDLFIIEDTDEQGFKAQNFIYATSEISDQFSKIERGPWITEHLIEFFTKSISVFYIGLFWITHDVVMYNFATEGLVKLGFWYGPPAMVILPSLYYCFWSSTTKSSFLKFCFRFELMMMLVFALAYTLFFYILGN